MSRAVRALMSLVKKKKLPQKKSLLLGQQYLLLFSLSLTTRSSAALLAQISKSHTWYLQNKSTHYGKNSIPPREKKTVNFQSYSKSQTQKKSNRTIKSTEEAALKKKTRCSLSVLVISFAFFFLPLDGISKKKVKSALWFFFLKKKKQNKV